MLSFYPFSTNLMHSLSYVVQTVRSDSIVSINCATIQEPLQNYFKLKKPKFKDYNAITKFINSYTKRVSMALNGCFWQERASREIFQLLLQQITVVFEVTKIRFNICLTFFLPRF